MSVNNAALSGLRAANIDLQVTGNNIANAGTFGFKQSRTEFADLFVSMVSGSQVGNGVKVARTSQEFSQVGFSVTGSPYDLAINGDGFFMLKGINKGVPLFTRAGNFTVDRQGYITSQTGDRLQGYISVNNTLTATVGDLQIPNDAKPPQPTSSVSVDLNLDASSKPIASPFDMGNAETYNNRTSLTAYDSLGGSHLINTYYVKTSDNNWDVHIESEGNILSSGTLTFNNDGSLQSSTGITSISWDPGNGAAPGQSLDFTYSKTTQFGSGTVVRGLDADGYTTGIPANVSIDDNGVVLLLYSNGETGEVGQVALARFDNPQGLRSMGDTAWSETNDSGRALVNADNSVGALRSGALEDSNVDLTEQLVRLVTTQRLFQANAQSIRAGDVLTQTVINLE